MACRNIWQYRRKVNDFPPDGVLASHRPQHRGRNVIGTGNARPRN